MYIMCMYVHVHMYIMYTCIYMYMCMYMYVPTYMYMYIVGILLLPPALSGKVVVVKSLVVLEVN